MEKFNLRYSKKNIPIPSRHEYKQMLVAKTKNLIRRMRWKVMEFDGKLQPSSKWIFGFRTLNLPSPSPDLDKFECDLMDMICNVKFRRVENDFQRQMKEDIIKIKNCASVVVSADKSTNLYKMDKDSYEQYVSNCITSTYKKSENHRIESINQGAYTCAKNLELDDRMEKLESSEAYIITVKDHKENFNANPTFRLINPSKQDIGRVSKQLLDGINQELLSCTSVNQWKNSRAVTG